MTRVGCMQGSSGVGESSRVGEKKAERRDERDARYAPACSRLLHPRVNGPPPRKRERVRCMELTNELGCAEFLVFHRGVQGSFD